MRHCRVEACSTGALRRRRLLLGSFLGGGLLITGAKCALSADQPPETYWSNCMITPKQTVQLGSPVLGILAKLEVERGYSVVTGQVLARLDTTVEEAQLSLDRYRSTLTMAEESAKADLGWNQRELARRVRLEGNMFSKANEIDEIKTKIDQDKIAIDKAEADLETVRLEALRSERQRDLKILKSPLDGVVTDIKLHPGDFVNEQVPVMTLAQIDPLQVELILSPSNYSAIGQSMMVDVTLDKPVSRVVQAKVKFIDPVIDPASNSFRVWLELPNPGNGIPAGVRCNVHLPDGPGEG